MLKEDRQAFGVLVSKSATLEEAFKYPLTTVPLSIADANTAMRQGDKAGFRNLIIKEADAVEKTHIINAKWIYDGTAVI